MKPGLDPKMDFVFKKVFGSEEQKVLVHLLNAVISPKIGAEVQSVILANPYSEKEAAEDKGVILDIKATDQRKRWFNVEMQPIAPRLFPSRILYYWALLHSRQLTEGEKYNKLCQTVSISFVDSKLFDDSEFHHVFRLIDQTGKILLTDQLAIHVIELPKFNLTAEELTTPLDVWCYFLRKAESLDDAALPKALDIPTVIKAMRILATMSQNTHEREIYEKRLQLACDQEVRLDDATTRGYEKGIDRGEVIGRVRLSQEMLGLPVSPREELKVLAPGELLTLDDRLKQQLLKSRP